MAKLRLSEVGEGKAGAGTRAILGARARSSWEPAGVVPGADEAWARNSGGSMPSLREGAVGEQEVEELEDAEALDNDDTIGDSHYLRGKRFKKLFKLLSSDVVQQPVQRYRTHTLFLVLLLIAVHTGCFALMYTIVGTQSQLVATLGDVGTAGILATEVATFSRTLNMHYSNMTVPDGPGGPGLRLASSPEDLPYLKQLLSEHTDAFYTMHQKAYAGMARAGGRLPTKDGLRNLWDADSLKGIVFTNIAVNQSLGNFSTLNLYNSTKLMGLWTAGNQLAAKARSLLQNGEAYLRTLGPSIADFMYNPDLLYIVTNGPNLVFEGYKSTMDIYMQIVISSSASANNLQLVLLAAEGGVLCLLCVVWVWLLLRAVAERRYQMYQILMVVPGGLVRRMATQRQRLGDESEDEEDERMLTAPTLTAQMAVRKSQKAPGIRFEQDAEDVEEGAVHTVEKGRPGAAAAGGVGRAGPGSCWQALLRGLGWVPAALTSSKQESGKGSKRQLSPSVKTSVRRSSSMLWLIWPIAVWGPTGAVCLLCTTVMLFYAIGFQLMATINGPISLFNIVSFTQLLYNANNFFLQELTFEPNPANMPQLRASTVQRIKELEMHYKVMLYGHESVPTTASAPYITLVSSGVTYTGSHGNYILFDTKECLASGLDTMMSHYMEIGTSITQFQYLDPYLNGPEYNFYWNTIPDMSGGFERLSEAYQVFVNDNLRVVLSLHICLFVFTLVLMAVYVGLMVLPFVKVTRNETRRIAELVSQLPAEVDMEATLAKAQMAELLLGPAVPPPYDAMKSSKSLKKSGDGWHEQHWREASGGAEERMHSFVQRGQQVAGAAAPTGTQPLGPKGQQVAGAAAPTGTQPLGQQAAGVDTPTGTQPQDQQAAVAGAPTGTQRLGPWAAAAGAATGRQPLGADEAWARNSGGSMPSLREGAVGEQEVEELEDAEALDNDDTIGDSHYLRGKRFKKLFKLLSSDVVQQPVQRYRTHTLFLVLLLIAVHTGCFALMYTIVGTQSQLVATLGDVGTAGILATEVATFSRTLNMHYSNMTVPDGPGGPGLRLASSPEDLPYLKQVRGLANADSLKGIVFTNIAVNQSLGNFSTLNLYNSTKLMGLWTAGNRLAAKARSLLQNGEAYLRTLGPSIADFMYNPDLLYIVTNGPNLVFEGYKSTMDIYMQIVISSSASANNLQLVLLAAEGGVLCLLCVVWVWLLLRAVAERRYQMYQILMVVPGGLVRRMATQRQRLGDESEDEEDERMLTAPTLTAQMAVRKSQKAPGIRFEQDAEDVEEGAVHTVEKGRPGAAAAGGVGRAGPGSCWQALLRGLGWVPAALTSSKQESGKGSKRQLSPSVKTSEGGWGPDDGGLWSVDLGGLWGWMCSGVLRCGMDWGGGGTVVWGWVGCITMPCTVLTLLLCALQLLYNANNFFLQELTFEPNPANMPQLRASTVQRIKELEMHYKVMLYGHKVGAGRQTGLPCLACLPACPQSVPTTASAPYITLVSSGVTYTGSHGNYILFDTKECLASGLDTMMSHYMEIGTSITQFQYLDPYLNGPEYNFYWNTIPDMSGGFERLSEAYQVFVNDNLRVVLSLHICLFVFTLVLMAVYVGLMVLPFVKVTRNETRRIAELVSQLPAEVGGHGPSRHAPHV
ncbi:hypothetical protein QJQ45_027473 [Haematococcus lacustris]|nr:hypothetical protein QJQ45_027473 [Haematococcus lacustris]